MTFVHLTEEQVAWRDELLETLGDDPYNGDDLAEYLIEKKRWADSEQQVTALGLVIKRGSSVIENPFIKISRDASARLLEVRRRFPSL